MTTAERKHEVMYSLFGRDNKHKCKECSNFIFIRPTDRRHSKCQVYGVTHSEATDWNGRKPACGMFNQNYDDVSQITVIDRLRHMPRITVQPQCEKQISLFDKGD